MKKIFMTLAAVLCCAIVSIMFNACTANDDNPVPDNEEQWDPQSNVFSYTYAGQTLYYRLRTDATTKQTYAIVSYPVLTPTNSQNTWEGFQKPVGDIVIPYTVEHNGKYYPVRDFGRAAFIYCDEVTSVKIPEGVFKMGNGALAYCSRLQSVSLPSTLDTIGNMAFYIDSMLTELTIPQNVSTLGNSAVRRCLRLASLTLPDKMSDIGDWCFADDSLLTAIKLPVGITSIKDGSFYNCKGLTTITIPDGVTTIGLQAFQYCFGLKTVELPQSLTEIDRFVFYGDNNLETITLACTTPPSVPDNSFTAFNATIQVPVGTSEAYRQHPVWGRFANIVEK